MDKKIFINRRTGKDRREDTDLCEGLDVDLYHRKRRKGGERRQDRTLDEDYYAFIASQSSSDNNDDSSPSDSPRH